MVEILIDAGTALVLSAISFLSGIVCWLAAKKIAKARIELERSRGEHRW